MPNDPLSVFTANFQALSPEQQQQFLAQISAFIDNLFTLASAWIDAMHAAPQPTPPPPPTGPMSPVAKK
jgi:hypothetical protein